MFRVSTLTKMLSQIGAGGYAILRREISDIKRDNSTMLGVSQRRQDLPR